MYIPIPEYSSILIHTAYICIYAVPPANPLSTWWYEQERRGQCLLHHITAGMFKRNLKMYMWILAENQRPACIFVCSQDITRSIRLLTFLFGSHQFHLIHNSDARNIQRIFPEKFVLGRLPLKAVRALVHWDPKNTFSKHGFRMEPVAFFEIYVASSVWALLRTCVQGGLFLQKPSQPSGDRPS